MVRDQEPENNGGCGSSVLENGSQAHGSREKHRQYGRLVWGAATTPLDWVRRQAGKPALRSGGGGGGWVCGRRAPLS